MIKAQFYQLSILSGFLLISASSTLASMQAKALVDQSEFSTCMQCHAPIKRGFNLHTGNYPSLPKEFTVHWTLREVAKNLPFDKKKPGKSGPPYAYQSKQLRFESYRQGRGVTYYDWPNRKMVEEHYDFCVPIFPKGDDFHCKFIGVNNIAYLVTYNKSGTANCCKFMKNFGVPKPTILQNMRRDKTLKIKQNLTDWWIMPIPYPGPFGFGFVHGSNQPSGFWFRSAHGWSMMNFYNFKRTVKNKDVFDLPKVCRAAKSCNLLSLGDK